MPALRRNHVCCLAALFATLFAPAPAAGQGTEPPAVTGRVLDVRTGAPVEGALVSIPRLRIAARTDSSGTFVLQRVPPGTYTWSVVRLGYVPLNQEVELGAGDSFTVGMMARAMTMEGITVRARRAERLLRRRRGAARVSVRTLGEEALSGAAPSAESVVRLHVPTHPCAGSGMADEAVCVWHRGASVPLRVFIDERRAFSISELAGYNSTDLYLVEFWGGTEVRVYTRRFAERLAQGTERLFPRR